MTSQRFLNDKVNSRDFLRSLIEACKAPIVILLFISFNTIGPIASFAKELKRNTEYMELLRKRELISYFGGAKSEYDYFDTNIFCILMVLCGAIVAFSLFSFAFKKNSVNVYFSMGITRTRLFMNRVAAGAAELFVISFIPYLIVFLANVSLFGYNVHQLKLLGYYTLLMFIRGMSGFAIGAFAASVSGSIIETVFTTGSASVIFVVAAALFIGFKNLFLLGYVGEGYDTEQKLMLLTPWFGLYEQSSHSKLITGKKVPEEYLLTWKTDLFPIVLWMAASVIILAVALFLFKKRKNENTGSFGKYYIASALNGAAILLASLYVLAELFSSLYAGNTIKSIPLCIILCTVISFVIFFIVELIIRRKIKAVLRILPVYGGIALTVFAMLIVIGTGYFGTFNKLPEAKDIEYVSMDYSDPLGFLNCHVNIYSPESYDKEDSHFCKSSNPEDIKLCIEQFNKIKNDKRTERGELHYVEFLIKTKDGKFMVRRFPVYSEEISYGYDKAVFNSEYFHSIIKMNLMNKTDVETVPESTEYGGEMYDGYDKYYPSNFFDYFDGTLISDSDDSDSEYYYETPCSTYEITNELSKALYEDLCKMTFDEYYGNMGDPVGAIASSSYKPMHEAYKYEVMNGYLRVCLLNGEDSKAADESKTTIAYSAILVYPQMSKTCELLKELEPSTYSASVKAVICTDKKLLFSEAYNNLDGYYYGNSYTAFVSGRESRGDYYWLEGSSCSELFGNKPSGTYLDFVETVYAASGVKLSRVDDQAKANKIADAAKMVYNTYGDNGRYVFVIYDDGSIIVKYLPEKSLSVLD